LEEARPELDARNRSARSLRELEFNVRRPQGRSKFDWLYLPIDWTREDKVGDDA